MRRPFSASAALLGRAAGEATGLGETIARLRALLERATDFDVPWRRFHDDLAMSPDFMNEGVPATNARIDDALAAVACKVLRNEREISDPMFFHLEEHGLWHGAAEFGSHPLIFFYFDEANTGLVGIMKSSLTQHMALVRFSVLELPPGVGPSRERGSA